MLRARNEIRPQRIALDIANDLVKVFVRFSRERLVAALIEMTVTHAAPVDLPVARVRDGQLLHERREIAIALRPQNQMPVVRHQAVAQNPHWATLERLLEDLLKRLEVGVLQKQPHPSHATIQDVEQHSARR